MNPAGRHNVVNLAGGGNVGSHRFRLNFDGRIGRAFGILYSSETGETSMAQRP